MSDVISGKRSFSCALERRASQETLSENLQSSVAVALSMGIPEVPCYYSSRAPTADLGTVSLMRNECVFFFEKWRVFSR